MLIYGIDPSLTGTAVAVWQSGIDQPIIRRFTSEPAGGLRGRVTRYVALAQQVADLIMDRMDKANKEPIVFLEGYSFASKGSSFISLAEYGGILRAELLAVATVYEVSPSELKKFVTGKGTSEKEVLRAHVARRWKVIHETSDETDAFSLAWLGLCYTGAMECDNDVQRGVTSGSIGWE